MTHRVRPAATKTADAISATLVVVVAIGRVNNRTRFMVDRFSAIVLRAMFSRLHRSMRVCCDVHTTIHVECPRIVAHDCDGDGRGQVVLFTYTLFADFNTSDVYFLRHECYNLMTIYLIL